MSVEKSCLWINSLKDDGWGGEKKMEKIIGEDELKGLEEEIDSAVDRLFVDKKTGVTDHFLIESSVIESSLKSAVDELPKESPTFEPLPKPSSYESSPIPFLKSIEKLEAQLLSLEWEITHEKLRKTQEEVFNLIELLKQKEDMTSVLNYMEKVLSHMIKNEEHIHPSWIKFLLDSKDTLKLLMRKENDGEFNIYKQLAFLGIEARFFTLPGMAPPLFPSTPPIENEELKKEETPRIEIKPIEDTLSEVLSRITSFSDRMEKFFKRLEPWLSKMDQIGQTHSEEEVKPKPIPVNFTVFRVDEKLFGIETDKVFKLFKVPNSFQEKYSHQQKILLKGFEIKMVHLEKIFSLPSGEPKGEMKILMVKDNGEYKGLLIDQVLKKLSTFPEKHEESEEYFSGVIHSTFQEQPIEIPILNMRKL